MPSVYDMDNFTGRVDFAARHIAKGFHSTRKFDTCFEMHDGDCVLVALVRRAEARPLGRLAAKLYRYMDRDSAASVCKRLDHIPTRGLPVEAHNMRVKAKADFEAVLAKRDSDGR